MPPTSESSPTTTAATTTTPTTAPAKPAVFAAACNNTLVASTPGTVASSALVELSGIVASRRTNGVWWAHNDSGDTARLFAIGDNGHDLGQYALSGASAVDWEDIAAGPGPTAGVNYLYAGDIGDNGHTRASIRVYRVPEPAVDPNAPTPAPQTLTGVDALTFTYPDAPHDAESLIVDPTSGELFIITKDFSGVSQVFRAPAKLAAGSTTMLAQVATVKLGTALGILATGADVTPNGDVVVLRTYSSVSLYQRLPGKPLASAFSNPRCAGKIASEPQGEAIGFTRDGRGYVTSSEGQHPALNRFTAP